MTITFNAIVMLVAILLFFVAAIVGFEWFGTSDRVDAVGWLALGLMAFTAAHLPLHRSP